jgi:hypothetical protein
MVTPWGAPARRTPAETRVRLWDPAGCRHGRQEGTSTVDVAGDRNMPRRLRRRRRARCARTLAVATVIPRASAT